MQLESATENAIKKKNQIQNLLFAVGQFAIFAHSHGLLLDVVLCEKSWLTSDHLHDGSGNNHLVDGLIGAPGLPLFRRNDLEVNQREKYRMRSFDGVSEKSAMLQLLEHLNKNVF